MKKLEQTQFYIKQLTDMRINHFNEVIKDLSNNIWHKVSDNCGKEINDWLMKKRQKTA